jgi:selenocysteine-specific elongation factor
MNIIVGTAGHIDHGKTTLIKALTGTDTDRLPEEKKRGITIDLGFAELSLGEQRIGFVDVPGHERFVKNMLAGASGIDLVLLIIAADEGVMPQTREHFDICRLLGVTGGLVVLTKKDMVDDELLELVRMETAELVEGSFLQGAPVVAVSSTTGEGLDDLRRAIETSAKNVRARRGDQVARLPIDRSFVVKGFGTVVTGTLASGTFTEGGELELMPVRKKVRVRGLQTHGKETGGATAGQRVAVNLAGVDHGEIERGMTLCEPGTLEPVQMFDAKVEVLKNAARPLRSRQRVRVHIGTAEALARVHLISAEKEIVPGSDGFVQLRLETPVTAVMGETFIIRSYSPAITIAGGRVIDPMPAKHRGRDTAAAKTFLDNLLQSGEDHRAVIDLLVAAAGVRGADFHGLQSRTGWKAEVIKDTLVADLKDGSIVDAGGRWLASSSFSELKNSAAGAVAGHHKRDPLSRGIPREELRERVFGKVPQEIFKSVIASLEQDGKLASDNDLVRSPSHSRSLTADEAAFLQGVNATLSSAGLGPAKIDEVIAEAMNGTKISAAQAQKLIQHAVNSGDIVKVSNEFYFSRSSIDAFAKTLRERAASLPNRLIDVPAFKDLAGVSRKFAIPLLEYFDRVGVTKRAGDKRIIV